MAENNTLLEDISCAMHGHVFTYLNKTYDCVGLKIIAGPQLAIYTNKQTLVLLPSQTDNIQIKHRIEHIKTRKREYDVSNRTKLNNTSRKMYITDDSDDIETSCEDLTSSWPPEHDKLLLMKSQGLLKTTYAKLAVKFKRTTASVSQRAYYLRQQEIPIG